MLRRIRVLIVAVVAGLAGWCPPAFGQEFWVNLDPGSPDRVIDERLAGTEAGQILLETDMVRKRATAQLMNADSVIGKQLWSEWQGPRCTSYRNTIADGLRVQLAGCAEISEHDQALLDRLIVPVIQHEVDTAPEYAELRGLSVAAQRQNRVQVDTRAAHQHYVESQRGNGFVILGGIELRGNFGG